MGQSIASVQDRNAKQQERQREEKSPKEPAVFELNKKPLPVRKKDQFVFKGAAEEQAICSYAKNPKIKQAAIKQGKW